MERSAQEATGSGEAATSAHPGQVGRVRVLEEGTFADEPPAARPDDGAWSPQAILLGIVALLIIVGALLLIVWGSFQL